MVEKIKVALVGIGNCFSGLIQGIEYYKQNPSQEVIGIIHEKLRDYTIHDIDFVAGFDVGENKIGKSLNEAIYEYPNMVDWIPKDTMPKTDAKIYESPALDGVGIWVENRVKPIQSGKKIEELEKEIKNTIDWAKDQDDPDPQEEIDDMFASRTTPVFQNDESSTETMNFIEAITNGLDEVMDKDEDVFMMGEDIGVFEGAFKATNGLSEKYGTSRVLDTPISEAAFMGAGVGAALAGKKPIIELQFYDFVYPALDQITTEAAKYYWKAGKPVPIVVRGPTGAGTRSGPFHSISPESLLAHHPGIKVVAPSNPYDAKGLLVSSMFDPNPVMYLEHKKLYRNCLLYTSPSPRDS